MTIQEALKSALERPIKDLGKFIVTRENQRQFCGAFFIVVDEEGQLAVRDWESDPNVNTAKLFFDDILADDWVLEEYERGK